jgi:hypothetical protein
MLVIDAIADDQHLAATVMADPRLKVEVALNEKGPPPLGAGIYPCSVDAKGEDPSHVAG